LFAVAEAIIPLLTGLAALMAVGTFTSAWSFVPTFLLGALLGAVPLLWAWVRFVPLVRRGA